MTASPSGGGPELSAEITSAGRSHGPREPTSREAAPAPDGSITEGAPTRRQSEEVYHCDLCGSVMLNLHCKLICERCGYKRDCSDP